MAEITPFCAVRPASGKAAMVPSHAVESYTHEQIKEILASNPCSFLQVIYAGKENDIHKEAQLHKIKEEFHTFIDKGIFVKDTAPCYYIYRQIRNGRSHLGVIALASLRDYASGIIRIHELTLAEREQKMKEYLSVCEINAEPVCMAYPYTKKIDDWLQEKSKNAALYDYELDGMRHTVWQVNDSEDILKLGGFFKEIPFLYIADGHHRAASSFLLWQEKLKNKGFTYFMASFFSDREVTIFNYDRLISDLNRLSGEEISKTLSRDFDVKYLGSEPVAPQSRGEITMYLDAKWYSLTFAQNKIMSGDLLQLLDVSILNDYILNPLFGIVDLRMDKRIAFMPGIKGPGKIMDAVNKGKYKAGFCLYPVSFNDLKAIADSGKEMPPKSTWIEPKLESGLLIYSFDKLPI